MPRRLTWYFDVISPYAYLQTADLDRLPPGTEVIAKPVLFAGLLNHWGRRDRRKFPPSACTPIANAPGWPASAACRFVCRLPIRSTR